MLGGVSTLSLDSKGRLAIPARHRETLCADFGDRLVVTLESLNCLLVYPQKTWLPVAEKIAALPANNPAALRYQRLLLGHAETLEMDSAGRVLLPAKLRQMTGLDKKVVLVGMGRRFELWDEDRWDAETMATLALPPGELTGQLGELPT